MPIKFKKKKIINQFTALLLILFLLLPTSFGPIVSISFAEDSPEEIAREEEEARREAERRAQKAAAREAEAQEEAQEEQMEDQIDNQRRQAHDLEEAQREQEEARQEYLEDNPLPTPTPTVVPTATVAPQTIAENTDVGAGSTNDASASSNTDADIEVENSGSLEQELITVSNSGNNTTSGDSPPPTATPQPTEVPKEPLPACDDNQTIDNNPAAHEDDHTVDSTTNNFSDSSGGGGSQDEESSTAQLANNNGSDAGKPEDGGDSDTTITNNDDVTVTNNHCANIDNDEEVTAMSGGNEQVGNEDANTMETGGAISEAQLANYGNTNQVEVDTQKKAENKDTEDGSSSDTTVDNTTDLTVDNNNQISADNHLKASAVSGGNKSTDHDGFANVSTGDIEILVKLLNILNMNITGTDFTHLIINIFEDLTGELDLDKIAAQLGMDEEEIEIIARNSRTGKESHNNAEINNELNLTVNNNNDAVVRNDVNVAGVSGANDVSRDEDKIDVQTGRIKILVAIMNFINANFSGSDWYFAMINIFADLHGDIILPDPDGYLGQVAATNENTGANSNNDAQVNDQHNIVAANANEAQVTNRVTAVGDSGSNDAYANDDRVKTETGEVNVLNRALNWLNTNIFGEHFVLLVVNVLGRWLGHVVAFPGKGNIDAPEGGVLVAAAGAGTGGPSVSAENSDTGEGSTNEATVNNEANFAVNNTNQARVENDVNISGISGQNTTNENDGRVNVFTGWIDISSGLLNVVNFNVTGRNWLMVMVNVFGDFWGNIVFPNGEKPQPLANKIAQVPQDLTDSDFSENGGQAIGGVDEAVYQPFSSGSETGEADVNMKKAEATPTPIPPVKYPIFGQNSGQDWLTEETVETDSEDFQEARIFVYTSENNPPQDGSQLAFLGLSGKVLPVPEEQIGLAVIAAIFIFTLRRLPFIVYRRKEVS